MYEVVLEPGGGSERFNPKVPVCKSESVLAVLAHLFGKPVQTVFCHKDRLLTGLAGLALAWGEVPQIER